MDAEKWFPWGFQIFVSSVHHCVPHIANGQLGRIVHILVRSKKGLYLWFDVDWELCLWREKTDSHSLGGCLSFLHECVLHTVNGEL